MLKKNFNRGTLFVTKNHNSLINKLLHEFLNIFHTLTLPAQKKGRLTAAPFLTRIVIIIF